ncbi:MAG: DNA primase [Patescibacteria group bacterium]|nr:DNA primase [Patescibacteria group bacterium]
MLSNVDEIKSRLDIVDIISEFVPLRQSGANFKGLCPFHTEKTPSFMVSREKQFFKCFGCGEAGDMFSFLEKMEKIEFPEALKILAEKAGVQLVKQDSRVTTLKTRLMDMHRSAMEFFQNQLHAPVGEVALKYLIEKRHLTPETIAEFHLGYAPNSWIHLSGFLKSKGFSDNEIMQSGLTVPKNTGQPPYYERFRHRLMFPIADHHGNMVGFTARAMDDKESAKYINTPQTLIYNKSQVVYGLDKAKNAIKENDLAILVEGNMDVIGTAQAGTKNVVAVSGTSLTFDQIKLIKRYSKNVALCFDADAAGAAAGVRGIEMLWQEEMNIKVIILPSGVKDPDELAQKDAVAWQKAVAEADDFMEYFFDKAVANRDLNNLEQKRIVAKILLPWIARLTDPIAQNHYLKLLAELIKIDEHMLAQSIAKIKNKLAGKPMAVSKQNQVAPQKFSRREMIAERLLALMMRRFDFLGRAANVLGEEHFENMSREFYKTLVIHYTKYNGLNFEALEYEIKEAKNPKIVEFFDALNLLGQTEFEEMSERELAHELDGDIEFLRQTIASGKRADLMEKIKLAEKAGDMNLANQLLSEFAKIN